MLKIRLQRFGKRNQPTFRLVVVDSRRGTQSGKFIETLGWHNPRSKEGNVDAERVKHWMGEGAQASDSAHNFLVKRGVINEPKRTLRGRKGIHTVEKPAEEASEQEKEAPAEADAPSESGEQSEEQLEAPGEKKEESTEEETQA